MHNPTRRVKRFRPLYQLPETGTPDVSGEDHLTRTGSNHGRHRQTARSDTLRGAMLVVLIVITIVLYIVLKELERSPFASMPKPNWTKATMVASSSSSSSETTLTRRYPPASFQKKPVSASDGETKVIEDRTAVSSGRTMRNAWPPPITRIPEEHDTGVLHEEKIDVRTYENDNTEPSLFDYNYCNGTCRFLLPVRIGEQESKARGHFVQLLMLARRLNRTMVLPNVGKSRMSACSQWSFGAYYDANVFAHRGESPNSWPAMDLEMFAKWVNERPALPSSFVVSMESTHQGHRDGLETRAEPVDVPFIVEKTEVDPKILACLEPKLARLRPSIPETALSISFYSGSLKTGSDPSTHLVQLLSNSIDVDAEPDFDLMPGPGYGYTPYTNSSYLSLLDVNVLVFDYDLRYPLFTASVQPNFNLHYAPALYDLADRLTDNLGPFLGVQWRMENVPVQNLAWCAASLVSTLRTLLKDDVTGKDVRHVWLATDHPRPLRIFTDGRTSSGVGEGMEGNAFEDYGPLRKSSTFHVLSSEHDDAIRTLTEAFRTGGDLEGWKLTDLSEQLSRHPYIEGKFDVNETLLSDSGVFGILDKLVVVQARMFVSGSADCSKTSSFSKQIIEARQESFEAKRGKSAILNVVEYFGKW